MIRKQTRIVLLSSTLFIAVACASSEPVPVEPAPRTEALMPSELVRPIPYPVLETPRFRRAVENGTRTRTGAPGSDHWTQHAEYDIQATLDPETATLTGTGRIRYHNRSPDTLAVLRIHLRQNLHAEGAVRNRNVPVTGGMRVRRVVVQGNEMEVDPDDRFGTVVTVALPDSLPPLSSADLEIDWSFRVPPAPNSRMGTDGQVYFLAYWYPQLAVYDDVRGWVADPYMGAGEFYMGYGDYDVALTVPEGWLIGATGVLENPDEVLSERTRDRLEAAALDTVVHVVGADERGGDATADAEDGTLTWRFRAENVRDFAWGTSDDYVWDVSRTGVGDADGDGTDDTAAIHAFYRPDRTVWRNAAEFAAHAIAFHSGYVFPYPYPQATAIEGIIGGGMEYPMITLMGGGNDPERFYGLTAHELGHMWFPMVVGSDEKTFTWMDEGLTSFIDNQASHARWGAEPGISRSYLHIAGSGLEVEMMRHADRYPLGTPARGIAGYGKPASVLHMLRAMLGEETFNEAFRLYGERWHYRHPMPYDFFNTVEDVVGEEMDWFWTTWFYTTWHLDHAIAEVRTVEGTTTITIEDRGLAPMPVMLAVTREDGSVERLEVPVEVWLAGTRSHTLELEAEPAITRVEIDPEGDFANTDRSNNVWER